MPPMRIERASVCPLDCPDTCSLTVTVEDEKVVAVRGSTANPYTNGVLCAKVPALYPALVHGPGRPRTPPRRGGGRGGGPGRGPGGQRGPPGGARGGAGAGSAAGGGAARQRRGGGRRRGGGPVRAPGV